MEDPEQFGALASLFFGLNLATGGDKSAQALPEGHWQSIEPCLTNLKLETSG
jgi:hypothetical protein